ncbi:DHH family phosphoesterase, partial [bacterium]|nr:DHH family phosphoesterase [bacterium]
MELITTHLNADFDALASLVAAKKLHPASELCLPGSTEYNVGKFLQAYPDLISVKKVRQIKLDEISKLVIVDTQGFSRIGKFKKLLAKSIPIYIYDHHPPFKETGRICSCEVGATVTLLLKEIRKRKISITPMEATLFGLGIYEDTGSLTFPTTTARDIETVSFLLGQGADLSFISKFLIQELNPEQVSLLNSLLCDQRRYLLGEKKLAIALAQTRRYVRDLAVIAHQIMDMEGLDALFLAVKM